MDITGRGLWKTYDEIDYDSGDFLELGRDFARHYKNEIRTGRVGYAKAELFKQRTCVDFAEQWFHRKRR